MNKPKATQILDDIEKVFPHAGPRLKFSNVFELLVATILSAQSTDEQVNRVTEKLFEKYNKPEQFAKLQIEELEPLVQGCGLYHNKAKSIIEASKVILEKFDGKVPDTLEELVTLPGVGRKTANVVLAVGHHKPGLAVDTHVQRVANRLGIADSKNPDKTELQLKAQIPEERWGRAHHLLIFHGREICKALKPKCHECPLAKVCMENKGKAKKI
ncbi:MAG: endonuclease III [Candidatus Saccharibacteria bacterium]